MRSPSCDRSTQRQPPPSQPGLSELPYRPFRKRHNLATAFPLITTGVFLVIANVVFK